MITNVFCRQATTIRQSAGDVAVARAGARQRIAIAFRELCASRAREGRGAGAAPELLEEARELVKDQLLLQLARSDNLEVLRAIAAKL